MRNESKLLLGDMVNRKILLVSTLYIATGFPATPEQTVGLFINEKGSFQGYTLFAPLSYNMTYLINNEGSLVRSWESDYLPGYSAYLGNDGYLYRSFALEESPGFGGGGGGVEKLDWEGNLVWHFEYASTDYLQHHDIEVLPTGNVLIVAWEYISTSEELNAGRDSTEISPAGLWPDHIIEVKPTGYSTGEIIWEWHVWDHIVQEYDSTKANFGVVSMLPQFIDVNYYLSGIDWNHINSVSYNEELDQIILSSRTFEEIWVIDHSTTTDEAHGHSGGQHGKGGDILYRWGNPQTYERGDADDQQLFGQHDAQWIPSGCPGAGNILVFNNGTLRKRPYSSVVEIVPPVTEEGRYIGTLPYGPNEPCWSWTAPDPEDFFSPFVSGVQRMPNGNTLVCNGTQGTFFEITTDGEVVWKYVNPVNAGGPVHQGDEILDNSVFKIRRYPPDFQGFAGKDLTPVGPIEKYSAVEEPVTPVTPVTLITPAILEINPTILSFELSVPGHLQIKLYNALGQEVKTLVNETSAAGYHTITWNTADNHGQPLTSGVYFITLQFGNFIKTERITLIR